MLKKSSSFYFDQHMKALLFIAQQAPKRVATRNVADAMQIEIRTCQRMLKSLSDMDYLVVDDCNPRGYKVNMKKFKEFYSL